MSFDLRSKFAFDSTESQIAEGGFNSHANCVPASFTAALQLGGFPDIDPQLITDQVYGPNYRGGYGTFEKCLDWIAANVPNAPTWTHTGFNFDAAEQAGQAGELIVIAGWIDAPSVTFVAVGNARGFSHASLLVAHQADDTFVIWNVWFGTFQTYNRDVIAASLYEMAVMQSTGGDLMAQLSDAQVAQLLKESTDTNGTVNGIYNALEGRVSSVLDKLALLGPMDENIKAEYDELQNKRASILQDILSHETVAGAVATDPTLAAKVDALSKHLGIGSA
jgi:hypothetical protein